MGGAIARGLLSRPAHEVSPQQSAGLSVAVSNPTAAKLEPLAAEGARVTLSNVEAVGAEPDLVIICVKPWLVEQVINEIKPYIDYTHTEVAVVAAGIPLDSRLAYPSHCRRRAPSLASLLYRHAQHRSVAMSVNDLSGRRTGGLSAFAIGILAPWHSYGHRGKAASRRHITGFVWHSLCHALCAGGYGRRCRTRISRFRRPAYHRPDTHRGRITPFAARSASRE